MVKFIISVKKDRLNEHLLEGDHDFLSFLDILDKYTVTIDTLSNFSIVIDYEIRIPVYLSALKVLKSHSNNEEIIGKRIPIWQYVKGYNQGFQTDITPGVNKLEYHIENIITIFESMIQPFHYDNTYRQFDDSGMVGHVGKIGFSENLWFEYGIQIGKEKQAWEVIKKDPDSYIAYFDNKRKRNPEEINSNSILENAVEIKRILSIDDLVNDELKLLPKSENPNVSKIQNNFDGKTIVEIYNHFKIGLVDKKYLTDQELIDYLKVAFEHKSPPKIRFKIINAKKKQSVIHVFYEYYKNIACSPHGKQKEYAALLGEYFEGYNTNNVSSNFNK